MKLYSFTSVLYSIKLRQKTIKYIPKNRNKTFFNETALTSISLVGVFIFNVVGNLSDLCRRACLSKCID